ncbi:MAG TPA: EF-Tu/IF-2/RF-3 family GTPase [Candidatus Limnocylindrales bacterium]|nr:EF-Tu/IF-2/RF-3 family GTPase [Candidatus Limnocylindrales bacterium]
MGNVTVAVLGALDYGGNIGKKGTSTDITFYNLKKGEDTVSLIEPTRYPERLAPLFYAISLAKKAIVVVDQLDASFGECLVMLQCSEIKTGYFVLRNYIPKEKIEPLIRGSNLEKYEFISDDPNFLREQLLAEASKQKPVEVQVGQQSVGTVPIDHSFNVKGVGTVVLGIVAYGTVKKHETLNVLPSGKTAQLRSIQKHDDEFEMAGEGDRVGFALKNVEVEDVDRGVVLTNDPSIKVASKIETHASLVKYWQTPLKPGMVMHIGHWTQFLTAKVEKVDAAGEPSEPTLTLMLDKPLVYRSKGKAILMYLEGAKLRVAGTIELL